MHTSELRWDQATSMVASVAEGLLEVVLRVEENYQELLEAYDYAGSTPILLAELLFYGTIDTSNIPTTDEIAKATDLRDAMVAAHDLYECMTDIAVPQGDRAAALRRMS